MELLDKLFLFDGSVVELVDTLNLGASALRCGSLELALTMSGKIQSKAAAALVISSLAANKKCERPDSCSMGAWWNW